MHLSVKKAGKDHQGQREGTSGGERLQKKAAANPPTERWGDQGPKGEERGGERALVLYVIVKTIELANLACTKTVVSHFLICFENLYCCTVHIMLCEVHKCIAT